MRIISASKETKRVYADAVSCVWNTPHLNYHLCSTVLKQTTNCHSNYGNNFKLFLYVINILCIHTYKYIIPIHMYTIIHIHKHTYIRVHSNKNLTLNKRTRLAFQIQPHFCFVVSSFSGMENSWLLMVFSRVAIVFMGVYVTICMYVYMYV